jgi:TorA maturation chaperone TorD
MTVLTESCVARAALWRLLSLGFMSPSAETLAEIDLLAEALLELPDPFEELTDVREAVAATAPEEAAASYQSVFGGKVLVAPYEGSYELDPIRQGREMADVAAFYRAFGAEAHGPAAERPDHVGCELEFLAFVEARRLQALDEGDESGAELVDDVTTTFLRDHAGRWLPAFFAAVQETAAAAPLHRTLAALGTAAIEAELERRAVEPTPVPRRRERISVERDSFECS